MEKKAKKQKGYANPHKMLNFCLVMSRSSIKALSYFHL